MIPLFTTGSLMVLESLSFTRSLYAFDYDGTLAKIVKNPEDAYMTQTTAKLIQELAALVPVAIISGRSIKDLKSRLHFSPQFVIGNHGLEGFGEDPANLEEANKVCELWNSTLIHRHFESGIEIENKTYSLSVHYRKSRNKGLAKKEIHSILSQLDPPPRIIEGKCVLNLLPSRSPHKGKAILDLIKFSNFKHIFYIGDDETDEDIFNMKYKDGQLMTVRVGRKKISQAKYYINHQSEINKLLRLLIKFNQISSPTNESVHSAWS